MIESCDDISFGDLVIEANFKQLKWTKLSTKKQQDDKGKHVLAITGKAFEFLISDKKSEKELNKVLINC